ncbi:Protein MICROTUBULE ORGANIZATION 1 [Trifolium repens]|nr:Protein MICROTUBULE ORGANIZATION 1 [Trifolium repens]
MSKEEKLLKEAKKLPWEDRLAHKNWKVRNEANVDLASLCDSITDPKEDPRIREFGRPKTVEKAQAVDAFLDAMEKAIKNKVAKAVVPAIDVMFQALSEFGSKIVPPKRILKMLPELFDHQDQNKMRDTMKKELEAEVVNVTGTAKPSRKIRSEQDKEPEQETISEVVGPGPAEESGADAPQEIDEYELVDPVDILTPLEKSEFWDGVKATKWLERKEAVGELTKLASTKRISPGDFSEVCRTLKKALLCHYPLKLSCSIMHRSISLNSHFMFSKLQAFEPPLDMSQDIDLNEDQHPEYGQKDHLVHEGINSHVNQPH